MEKIVQGLEQLADSVFDCGQQTEYAKLQIIITLAVMAAEIAYALATLWGAWAVSLIEAEGAGIIRLIASRLATALAARASRLAATPLWKLTAIQVLKQGAIGLGTDALAQGIELGQGHSKGFNVKQMFITGAVGAVSGGVATPIGHFGGKYLGNLVAKNGGMNWWKAGLVAVGSGIPAGVVGAGAGIVAYGAMTGQWEFDPAALLGGVGGGLVGGVHGVLGHFQGKFSAGAGGFEELPPYTAEDKPPPYGDGSSSLYDSKSGGLDTKGGEKGGSTSNSGEGQPRDVPQRSTTLRDNNIGNENTGNTQTRSPAESQPPAAARDASNNPFGQGNGSKSAVESSNVRDGKTNPFPRNDATQSQESNVRDGDTNPFRRGDGPQVRAESSNLRDESADPFRGAAGPKTPAESTNRYQATVEDAPEESGAQFSSNRSETPTEDSESCEVPGSGRGSARRIGYPIRLDSHHDTNGTRREPDEFSRAAQFDGILVTDYQVRYDDSWSVPESSARNGLRIVDAVGGPPHARACPRSTTGRAR